MDKIAEIKKKATADSYKYIRHAKVEELLHDVEYLIAELEQRDGEIQKLREEREQISQLSEMRYRCFRHAEQQFQSAQQEIERLRNDFLMQGNLAVNSLGKFQLREKKLIEGIRQALAQLANGSPKDAEVFLKRAVEENE